MPERDIQQLRLDPSKIKAFYSDKLANKQVADFLNLIHSCEGVESYNVVDIGGGHGHFSNQLVAQLGIKARVIDSDEQSLALCRRDYGVRVECELGNALYPRIRGDEDVICFNLVLHHLVSDSEAKTRELQKRALMVWKQQAKYLFVNEYIYESHYKDISGRLIYEVTVNSMLSHVASLVGKLFPALRANTLGVGVRFRSYQEWLRLFDECGLDVVDYVQGSFEPLLWPRKMLLIKGMRKDSFLLAPRLLA
jgi:hypothetical protein